MKKEGFELNETEETVNGIGPEINVTQGVTNSMAQDQLFDDNHACKIPVMELGFLVSGCYDQPLGVRQRSFRKAMEFVKKTAEKMKVSDSGTHVGLVVYGKKPSMAFDFNEYFNMPKLSEAIEEVKTPDGGNNVGQALLFTKKQLFDKSARPGIPKALIVLLTIKSEDVLQPGVDALREAGVNIYTVGIESKTDPMEMSDIASDAQKTFFSDYDHLGSLAAKLAPKLCQAPTELTMANDENNQMNPDEEPGAATAHVNNVNVTSPGLPLPGKKESSTKEGSQPNQKADTVDQGTRMAQNMARDDADFQDAVTKTSTSHVDTFDIPSEVEESNKETTEMDNETLDSASGEDMPSNAKNAAVDAGDLMHSSGYLVDNSSENPKGRIRPPVSRKQIGEKKSLKKTCLAKADIGILIDGSSSVKKDNFSKLLAFTKNLVSSFSVSSSRAHIAVATASRGPQIGFDFQGFQDVPSLNTAISRIAYHGGPFLLGSSLTGLKTTWFKNSGRTSIPQMLLVLATTASSDDIVAPSRMLRDRGVRVESVGIGPDFDGTQLKEIATHPAKDHVMAVSTFELLPMIRPLLTFRMCRAVGGKLIPAPNSADDQSGKSTSSSSGIEGQGIDAANVNRVQHLPTIKPVEQNTDANDENEADQNEENLKAQLEQLDKQERMNNASDSHQKDEIEKARIKEGIRRKLYAWLRHLRGSKKDMGAVYRSFIYNINGHHDSVNCKDRHDLCKQWAKSNLCERGNDIMDPQSVQRVCPKSCQVCFR
ncbi:cartilage matrix protein-like [Montipora foliosa]|uniref:cartilage matrix protein-like n=1 Tax=Montipora foliosa TaxID=591990 RepID=UPI0035F14FE2